MTDVCLHPKTYYNEQGEKCVDCGTYLMKVTNPQFQVRMRRFHQKMTPKRNKRSGKG